MKMQKSALLVMACTAVQAADFTLDTSDVTLYSRLPRTTAFGSLDADIGGFGYNFLLYTSVAGTSLLEATAEVSATEAEAAGSGSASASASFSGVYSGLCAGTGLPPTFYLASFDFAASASASASASADEEKTLLLDGGLDADMSASAGFLGMVYSGLTERTPDGDFVEFTSFAGDLLNVFNTGFDYDVSGVTDEGNGVKSAFMHATEGSLKVKLTMVASDKSGVLSSGSVITPTSVETIVDIEGYDYADAANHIELVVAVGTATAQFKAEGYAGANAASTMILSSGSGASQVYVDFAKHAQVDNADAVVEVTTTVGGNAYLAATVGASADASATVDVADIMGTSLKTMLSASASGSANGAANAEIMLVTVAFPAGADKIKFDPTAGAGRPISHPDPSAASSAALSFIAVASTFVIFFL